MKVQLANAHKYLYLPERYVFQATQVAEASGDMVRELTEQRQRVHRAFEEDRNDRMGDNPVPIERLARGERGERGGTGPQGQRGPMGPPGAPTSFDLDPVLRTMQHRLDESEAVRVRARDKELQDELSLIRAEAQRHAETARVLAHATANLTSLPNEIRAVAQATTRHATVDTLSHLRQAQEHYDRQARENHETNLQFLQRNASDIARFAGQMGQGIAQAFQNFKPPERELVVVQSRPPPPPPPAAGRIKRAAAKALAPPPRPSGPADGPPADGRPGSSNDPMLLAAPWRMAPAGPPPFQPVPGPARKALPAGLTPGRPAVPAGPPPGPPKKMTNKDAKSANKDDAKRGVNKDAPNLVKDKTRKKPAAGLSIQSTTKDHTERLTKHGKKPVLDKQVEEDPKPQWQYVHQKRKEPPKPPRTTILRKPPTEGGNAKKRRRVSTHDV